MGREKNLETILTLCTALVVLFLVFGVKWLLGIAIVLGLTGMFSNYLSGKIARAWLKLAEILGFVSSKILLSIVFFLVLTPIALLYRLFNKDKMQLKRKNTGSYYTVRNHEFTGKDLENIW